MASEHCFPLPFLWLLALCPQRCWRAVKGRLQNLHLKPARLIGASLPYLTGHFLSDDFQVSCPPIIYLASIFSGLLVSLGALEIIRYFTQGALKVRDFTLFLPI